MSKLRLTKTPSAPSGVPTDKLDLTFTSDNYIRVTDENGVSTLFTPSYVGAFGSEFFEASNTSTESNGSTTQDTYLALTHTETIGSKYRIGATVCWGMDSANRNIIIQLFNAGSLLGQLELEAKDTGNDIRNWNTSFFYVTSTATGTEDIEIKYAPESGQDTATMYYAGLEVWRVE